MAHSPSGFTLMKDFGKCTVNHGKHSSIRGLGWKLHKKF